MTDVAVRDAFSSAAREELARRRLADFIALLEPTDERARHTEAIGAHLEAIEAGEIERLMMFMPPRHGKTMHVSQAYPAWTFGRNSRAQIILASYGAELAEGNSRKARSYMRSDRWPFECRVSEESRAQNRWQTDAGGILIATGCEGGLTGYGADRLVIDDPIRDRADADSDPMRERLWQWYADVARTRLMPNGRIILCQTRWHDDDLAGRLLNSDEAKRWTVLSLPAIAEDGDTLGRLVGEALWPERFPVEALPKVPAEMSSSSFSALYQQNPVPAGGNTFKTAWLEHRYDTLPRVRIDDRSLLTEHPDQTCDILRTMYGVKPPELRPLIVQWIDSAWKTGPSNDRSCIATIVSDGVNCYIADVWADRVEYTNLKRIAVEQYEKWHPSRVFVEEAASGFALVAELKRGTSIPVIGRPPGRESKEARIEATTGTFEAGRVLFPNSAPWLDDVLNEFRRFPAAKFDDACEACCMGVVQAERIAREQRANWRENQRIIQMTQNWMER
jgi:predicted phage terminase large subunit-like protein